jgi:hypothetical protein
MVGRTRVPAAWFFFDLSYVRYIKPTFLLFRYCGVGMSGQISGSRMSWKRTYRGLLEALWVKPRYEVMVAACRSLLWRHEVQWFHPNVGRGPSRLVLCDEKGVGCGKRSHVQGLKASTIPFWVECHQPCMITSCGGLFSPSVLATNFTR